ncbi:MAG: hypothetical protein K5892_01815 [Acholeplasmatales bacterium]|nr:hypothetical protein [Acholeplasmatales bacterium]
MKRKYKFFSIIGMALISTSFLFSCGKKEKIKNDVVSSIISSNDVSTSTNNEVSSTSITSNGDVSSTTNKDTTTSSNVNTTTSTSTITSTNNDTTTSTSTNNQTSTTNETPSTSLDITTSETSISTNNDDNLFLVKIINQDENIGTIDGDYLYDNKEIEVGTNIELSVEVFSSGYEFDGWYINDEFYDDGDTLNYEMPSYDITIEARYNVYKTKVTIDNKVTNLKLEGMSEDNKYEYLSTQTFRSTNLPDGYYLKWTRSDNNVSYYGDSVDIKIPGNSLTITVELVPFKKENENEKDYIYFGSYPQSLVEDDDLISSLNNKSGSLPTSSNSNKWTPFSKLYSKGSNDYIWYIDIDLNNDGKNDYRGIYFNEYRPDTLPKKVKREGISVSISSQEYNGYQTFNIYWFKYEPIKWRILNEENGKAFLFSDLVLDSISYSPYDPDNESTTAEFEHNGGLGYANDYRLSDIRNWMISDFYYDAFNNIEQKLIESTYVKACTTGAHVKDTYDNIFLISQDEYENIYGILTQNYDNHIYTGKKGGTPYQACLGGDYQENIYSGKQTWVWYTRSKHSNPNAVASGRWDFAGNKTNRIAGVRPCIYLDLNNVIKSDEKITNDGYIISSDEDNNKLLRISNNEALEAYVSSVFSIAERGTVITATIIKGTLRKGDCIKIYNPNSLYPYVVEVKDIEVFKKLSDYAQEGDGIGILLGNQISKDEIEDNAIICGANDNVPLNYNYYIKINNLSSYNISVNNLYNLYTVFTSNARISYSLKFEALYDMNYNSVSSISNDDSNYYIARATSTNHLFFYPGLKGNFYYNGMPIGNYEIISCGNDTNIVRQYAQDFNSNINIKFESNTTYLKNDYIIYTLKEDIKISELFKKIKCEFYNPGYEFKGWGIFIDNSEEDAYEYVSNRNISTITPSMHIKAIWEQVSYNCRINGKEELDNGLALKVKTNFEELNKGDKLNILLSDHTFKEVTITDILNSDYESINSLSSNAGGIYYLIIDGIDFKDVLYNTYIYKI